MSPTSQRSELGELLRLAWPMMLTQLFIMGTGFLDTAMSGHYSPTDLAGVAMAGNILWPTFMLLTGVTTALTPIVAQLRGSSETPLAGARVRQGLWVSLVGATLLVTVILNARPLLMFAGVASEIIDIAMAYLRAVAWGAPAVVVYVALRNVCDGLGETRPAMYISALVLPINAFFNYGFVYGKFGLPELGGEGCGWATSIVLWIQLGLMVLVVRRPFFKQATVFSTFEGPKLHEIWRIVRLGLPIGIAMFLGMAVFSAIGILVGRLGVSQFAAHSIAGNLNWLTYVIPMGLGAAASIRVGYFTGAQKFDSARHAAGTSYRFALVYALVVSALLVLFRHALVGIYTTDPIVIEIATNLMLFIAVYQIVDDTQAVAVGALRGYKDTTWPMVFQVVGYWVIALPLGTVLAFGWAGVEPMGVYGYWTGMTIGLFLVACANGMRLWRTSHNDAFVQRLAAT